MSLIGNPDTPASYVADYMQACVGMFGIPAGGFTSDIETFGASNGYDVESLYAAMLNSTIGRSIYAPGISSESFATKLVDKVGGGLLSDADKAAAIDEVQALLDGGVSQAATAMAVVEFVAGLETSDETFGAVAQQFQNRIEIANYYTFSSTNPSSTLSTLTAVLSGVSNTTDVSDPEDYLDSVTDLGVSTGQTFTLTTGIDNVAGTSGNDTIIGDFGVTGQVSAADQINGGAGTDELQLYGTFGSLPTSISNVEKLNLSGFGVGKTIDVSTLTGVTDLILRNQTDVGSAGSGSDTSVTVAAGQKLTLNTVQDSQNGGQVVIVSAASSVTENTIVLDKAGDAATSGNDLNIEVAGAGVKTLNLQTANNASRVTFNDTASTTFAVETYNITGDKNLTATLVATASSATKATVNASTFTGALDLNLSATENFVVTGGTGNDRFNFGAAFDTSDKVAGGDGTDTVAVSTLTGVSTWLNNKTSGVADHSSIEVLEYTGTAVASYDAASVTLSGLTGFKTSGAIDGGAASGSSGAGTGLAVTNQSNAQTFTIAGNVDGQDGDAAAAAGGNGGTAVTFAPAVNNGSNAVNLTLYGVTLKGGDGGAGSGAGNNGGDGGTAADFSNYETINITSSGATSTAVNTFTGGAGGASAAAGGGADGATGATVVVSANATINISGANEINLGTISSSNQPVTINAANLTGKMTVGTGTGADVITGGSGVNVISLAGGADEVNLSASTAKADTLNVSANAASTSSAFAMVTGFTSAATTGDKLDFQGGTGTVLAGAGSSVDLGSTVTGLTGSLSSSGILTFGGTGAANATLANKITAAFSASFLNTNQDKAIAFEHDGSTYIAYADGGSAGFDAGSDVVVKLVGTTGITALSSTASDANTVFIA